ncbi:MAG: nucleotidyltransferase family protein [Deltaproteobacteria bacterium]|nr:nucleotidyltransferase family protein [Deltaproteobacteria bacterium]
MIVAVVLSAGASSRMGRPKALLPLDGVPFIERIVRALERTEVDRTLVVLGHNAEAMREAIAYLGVDTVVNPDYARGQLSSLHTAIRALDGEPVEAILVHLVDHPFIESRLVDRMIERFRAEEKLIVVPRFNGRRGHPVLFSGKLFPEFLAASLDTGAKPVVRGHPDETLELDTEEAGILVDIDTPEEYRKHVKDT